MQVINKHVIVCFDCDETLIHHCKNPENADLFIRYDSIGETYPVKINEIHCKLIKEMRHRDRYIIVWSARGHEWAEIVIKALGLEKHVDLIMTKPIGYVDDVDANEFMKRIYIRSEGE